MSHFVTRIHLSTSLPPFSTHTSPVITRIHLSTSLPPFSTHTSPVITCIHLSTSLPPFSTHTLPPTTGRSLKAVMTEFHILFLDPGPNSPAFISGRKRWKLHGSKCGLYSRCGEMVRSNCSIVCMVVWGLRLSCYSKTFLLCFWTSPNNCFKV